MQALETNWMNLKRVYHLVEDFMYRITSMPPMTKYEFHDNVFTKPRKIKAHNVKIDDSSIPLKTYPICVKLWFLNCPYSNVISTSRSPNFDEFSQQCLHFIHLERKTVYYKVILLAPKDCLNIPNHILVTWLWSDMRPFSILGFLKISK